MLPAGSAQVHYEPVLLDLCYLQDLAQVHYDPVLLDLCYLQELDVILCVWKLLQLSVSPPQIIDLLLQSLQSSFSFTHCSLFLIFDQPYQLRAASLNGADELSKDPLTVLHCCLCRALLGHAVIQALMSLNWDRNKLLFFFRLTLWDSTVSLSFWRSFSLCWILCWNVFCVSFSCVCKWMTVNITENYCH